MPVSRSTVRPERRIGPKDRRKHKEFSATPIFTARTGKKTFARSNPDGSPAERLEQDRRVGPVDRQKASKE